MRLAIFLLGVKASLLHDQCQQGVIRCRLIESNYKIPRSILSLSLSLLCKYVDFILEFASHQQPQFRDCQDVHLHLSGLFSGRFDCFLSIRLVYTHRKASQTMVSTCILWCKVHLDHIHSIRPHYIMDDSSSRLSAIDEYD